MNTPLLRLLLIGFLLLILGGSSAQADLIVNGSFESPSVYTAANPVDRIMQIDAGESVPGFGWNVTSGNVEVKGFDYLGGTANLPFDGTPFDGHQYLDLDGTVSGAIEQAFATIAGAKYTLSFAYTNNPYPAPGEVSSALVTVRDTLTNTDLLAPLSISSQLATPNDYHWLTSGPLTFTATGSSTTLAFASTDFPSSSAGVFLDGVMVVPEPGSLCLFGIGFGVLFVALFRRRQAIQTA